MFSTELCANLIFFLRKSSQRLVHASHMKKFINFVIFLKIENQCPIYTWAGPAHSITLFLFSQLYLCHIFFSSKKLPLKTQLFLENGHHTHHDIHPTAVSPALTTNTNNARVVPPATVTLLDG